jgi:tetratricopeptide (TPR) repeat protein
MNYTKFFKILLTILALNLFSLNFSWGQELADVTSSYNDALKEVNDNPEDAQTQLEVILPQAEALGEDGAEIKEKIEGMLPSLQYKTALAAYKAKDLDKAIQAFEKALSLAKEYDDQGIAKKIKPKLPALCYSRGRSLLKANKDKEANEYFDKAINLDDSYYNAYFGKSMVLRSGDRTQMYEQLDKAIELAGEDSKSAKSFKKSTRLFLYKEAKANVKSKKYQQALTDAEKAIAYAYKGAKDADRIYVQIGKAYAGLNKKADACAAYKKVTGAKYKKVADYERQYTLKCN